MQLKLKEILQNIDSIGKLLNKELPVKTAYRLGRLSKALQSELDQFNLTRNNLIKKYGKEKDGHVNYGKGANIGGFVKVADAMLAQGIV